MYYDGIAFIVCTDSLEYIFCSFFATIVRILTNATVIIKAILYIISLINNKIV